MLPILGLVTILAQVPAPAAKPVIDNDRVRVWQNVSLNRAMDLDVITISVDGGAVRADFTPRRDKAAPDYEKEFGQGRAMPPSLLLIELKDHPVQPVVNKTGLPLAFPRPGSKKLFENARVVVWDYTWTPGVATPMHFHDKDVVVYYLEDGDLQSTTPNGEKTVNPYKPGMIRFNLRDRSHTETLIRGKQHGIMTELK